MESGFDGVVNAGQRGPAKVEDVAAQHQHRRPPRRRADRFSVPRRLAPPGENVQIGNETDALRHGISVADCEGASKGRGEGLSS